MTEHPRPAIAARAGTRLDHRFTITIVGDGKDHGVYDAKQRVFQSGGRLGDFVFWKMRSITLSVKTWEATSDALTLEFIDHDKNVCYRISRADAEACATRYEAGAGPRMAVPLARWAKSGPPPAPEPPSPQPLPEPGAYHCPECGLEAPKQGDALGGYVIVKCREHGKKAIKAVP